MDGAARLDGDSWIRYDARDGLIDGPVTSILKGRDGAFWFAGEHKGRSAAVRFEPRAFSPGADTRGTGRILTEVDGLVGQSIGTGLVAVNGDIWFGTKWGSGQMGPLAGGGLVRFDGVSWKAFTMADGLLSDRIYDIGQTPDEAIWVGTL